MNDTNKYPRIVKTENNWVILLYSKGVALHLEGDYVGEYCYSDFDEYGCEDYGKEYLNCACGKIESLEHKEFLLDLYKNTFGDENRVVDYVDCEVIPSDDPTDLFKMFDDCLYLNTDKSNQLKLIKLPLLPDNSSSESISDNKTPQLGDEVLVKYYTSNFFYSYYHGVVSLMPDVDGDYVITIKVGDMKGKHCKAPLSDLYFPEETDKQGLLSEIILNIISSTETHDSTKVSLILDNFDNFKLLN